MIPAKQGLEENFHNLFNNVTDAVITSDLEDRVISWNRNAEKVFGRSAGEVTGKNLSQLIVPFDLWDERLAIIRQVKSGCVYAGIETERLRRDETRVNVNMTAAPLWDGHHNICGILYIFKDVTETKRLSDELKQSEGKFLSVVQSTADAIILADSIGNIISWNRSAQEIFQYSEKEVLGKPIT
ncbi:MAG TPA: PAS domain-containing protein, partial [Candidatus Methanoperedens sp.]